jgi:predicted permease
VYNVFSIALGIVATRLFKLPTWVTPAVTFNNTTSLPLLLFQALGATGLLSNMLEAGGDSVSSAVERAESYFLVNAVVSDCLTFALGPKLLNGHMGNTYKSAEAGRDESGEDERSENNQEEDQEGNNEAHERTSLLPEYVHDHRTRVQNGAYTKSKHHFDNLPYWARESLDFAYQFLNAPTIGAVIGVIVGLVPPLHKAFFADSGEGGIMNAWFTKCITNVGELFAALQIIVVGVKLSATMRRMKRGEASGTVPWKSMVFVTIVRFVVFPLMSIPLFWYFAAKTDALGGDPILWFSLMLMAAGPPAMIILPLADVNGSSEHDKMSIAKFLTVSRP